MPEPSIGRIAHYRSHGTPGGEYGQECRAAIITEVVNQIENVVSLAVLNPTGLFFDRLLRFDESGEKGGTWHWPTECPHGN